MNVKAINLHNTSNFSYVFLAFEDNGKHARIFLHQSDFIDDWSKLQKGMWVEGEVIQSDKGMRMRNARICSIPEEKRRYYKDQQSVYYFLESF